MEMGNKMEKETESRVQNTDNLPASTVLPCREDSRWHQQLCRIFHYEMRVSSTSISVAVHSTCMLNRYFAEIQAPAYAPLLFFRRTP